MTTTTETLYKVLDPGGKARNGLGFTWSLPRGKRPGAWSPAIVGDLVPCENGYHLCREHSLLNWLGPEIWVAEFRGDRLDEGDKIVVRQARLLRRLETWNDRTARLFACDCADEALRLVKEPDPRITEAVRVARMYAVGEATQEQLSSARAAARDAWSSARAAAWSSAGAAARDAARDWQKKRLSEYLRGER